MATKKVTITLDEDDLAKVRGLVEAGRSASVSGFVQRAVAVALADVGGWATMLEESLAQTGGPLTKRERAWADDILSSPARAPARGRRRSKAA